MSLLRSVFILLVLTWAASVSAQPTLRSQVGPAPLKCQSVPDGLNVFISYTNSIGDVLVLFGGRANSSDAPTLFGPSGAGWTPLFTVNSTGPKLGLWYKVATANNDSEIGQGSGSATHGTVYCGYAIVGSSIDPALFDATSVSTGQVTAVPNCPAITTVTANALIVCHSANSVTDSTIGSITSYTTLLSQSLPEQTINDTDDLTVGAASRVIAAPGANDPAAWSSWSSGVGASFTVAWKAAPAASPCGKRTLLGVGC